VGLDGVVPESANRGLGKSGKEGGSAKGKAAGAVVEKSDVLADPPKGRKKTPTAVVVPISNVPGAVVVGKKSDVRPDPKARKTPAAEGVVLGGVPGAVVVAKSDADPKGQKQPAVDGIAMCVGVRSAVVGEKTPDLMGLDEVPGDVPGYVPGEVTGMVVGRKSVNLGSPVSSPVSTDMRGSRTEGAVSAVGDTVVDSIGAGYNPQVRGSLVLEKVSIREKAAAVLEDP